MQYVEHDVLQSLRNSSAPPFLVRGQVAPPLTTWR